MNKKIRGQVLPKKRNKKSHSDFWLGVLENTLAGIFAGILVLLIAEHWMTKEIDQVVTEVKEEETQIHSVQLKLDQLGKNYDKSYPPKKAQGKKQ